MTAGFGLERLGLLTLKFPRATLLVVAVITAVMVFGGSRLGFSSDIREIFRSSSPDFVTLEEVARQYPGSDRDILIVVDGPDLFTLKRLEALRTLHLELSFVDDVGSVLSMFSARKPPDASGKTEPVFPAELSQIHDMNALRRELGEHPLVSGRLVSKDGKLGLVVLSLKGPSRDVEGLRKIIGEVRAKTDEFLAGTRLNYTLTGTAVMRVEIIGALIRDQQVFRIVGLAVATVLCWLFFRSFIYVAISLAPAGVAVIGLKGTMGLVGQQINVLTNIIPSLVMVIAFASALHLLFAIRRKLSRGESLEQAIALAVTEVGPACVLTSATTTIALLTLIVVRHPFITGFGITAAIGTAFTYVAIMATVPPLCRLLLVGKSHAAEGWGQADRIHRAIEAVSDGAARRVRAMPGPIVAIGVATTLFCGVLYALNSPRYQYQDNLPKGNPAFKAIEEINAKLSGTDTLRLLVQWPKGYVPSATERLDAVDGAHRILAAVPAMKLVASLHDVEQWFVKGGGNRDELFPFLEKSSPSLGRRMVAPEYNSALVTGYFGNLPAAQLVAIMDRLNRKLTAFAKTHPPVSFALTGLVPVSAKASTEMIRQLNLSLLGAVAVIILLIGFAFRSVAAGLQSILPNILPVMIAGAALYIFGRGLQFTSVVAFTIGFGIAVDSTIHMLNRYRLEKEERGNTADALDLTIRAIGPVLIVSTLVLIAGMGGTILSELPMVRLYGEVIVLLLTTALIGDLLLLPAIIQVADNWRRARGAGERPDARAGKRSAVQAK